MEKLLKIGSSSVRARWTTWSKWIICWFCFVSVRCFLLPLQEKVAHNSPGEFIQINTSHFNLKKTVLCMKVIHQLIQRYWIICTFFERKHFPFVFGEMFGEKKRLDTRSSVCVYVFFYSVPILFQNAIGVSMWEDKFRMPFD